MQVSVRVDINTFKCNGGNVMVAVDGEKMAEVDVAAKKEEVFTTETPEAKPA